MVCVKVMGWDGMGGACGTYGEERNSYTIFGRKPEGRPRFRWKFIRMDFEETARKAMDWIRLIQDIDKWRNFVRTVMNIRFSYNAE
jgi:hypothetical protein